MRRFVLFFMALFVGLSTVMAQQDKDAEKAAKKAEKEAKKAEKEARKAAAAAGEYALFDQAVKALEARDFVLEADRVESKKGRFVYVSAGTNFVSMHGEKASIQLAFNVPVSGPNGIGGVTVDGTASSVEMKTDKRGNITFEMSVQGAGVSARLYFRMNKGSNRCTATVSPNFSGKRISFTGHLLPTNQSRIFKGRSI